jgi:hypothetical protein
VTVRIFMLYGVPCGQCGLPAHSMEVYPNGVRTAHADSRKRPCDSPRTALKPPGRRSGSESPSLHGDSAPIRTPVSADRKVS